MTRHFGHNALSDSQVATLRRAIRLEWITMGFLAITVTLVALVLGNSQAMKTAWIEDILSFIPPIAFLIAVRVGSRRPTIEHPYGYHRSVGVGHLVAAVALTTMGVVLIVDSGSSLVKAEHPTIGTVVLFGHVIWLGWLMMAVMALTALPPVIIGRIKMGLANELHDKVLYADADMNKADWMTAVGTIIGVAGVGLGLWWLDSAAALFISGSILHDGLKNMKGAVLDLMDERAKTFDDRRPHPVAGEVQDYLRGLAWVKDAGVRVRDEGHVFHVEAFIVPRFGRAPSLKHLSEAREACAAMDWRVQDIVLIPVDSLPDTVESGRRRRSRP
ncbi:cation diffusion facilitator family transporter [Salinibacterium sp. SYSU T00001]|uniref:cation diffusion facilitator family transporter n=1 Tax=Homoserinimonas sedimenticola TaxID=2986805 RepID=UPI00223676FD|nr:cation diffusion facilitator family transporter [Salinibacterium sedimenticola]MCW4386643.1 cation diffusion facilitator family transporter [Salinibacterium sedimenticola]